QEARIDAAPPAVRPIAKHEGLAAPRQATYAETGNDGVPQRDLAGAGRHLDLLDPAFGQGRAFVRHAPSPLIRRAVSVPTLYPPQSMATHFPLMAEYGRKSRSFCGYRWTALVRCGEDHSLHTGEVVGSIPTAPTIFQRVIGSCRQ